MNYFFKQTGVFILTVLFAHGFTFFLASYLPSSFESIHGIYSLLLDDASNEESTEKSYWFILKDHLFLDFGFSIEGFPISSLLIKSILISTPSIICCCALIITSVFIVVRFIPLECYKNILKISDLLSFLPPFIIPFLTIVLIIYGLQELWFPNNIEIRIISILSMFFMISPVIISQTIRVSNNFYSSLIYKSLKLNSAEKSKIHKLLLIKIYYELFSTIEKQIVNMIIGLVFTETIFGLQGIGQTCLKAIQFNDINMILACVLFFSILVSTAKLIREISIKRIPEFNNEGGKKSYYSNSKTHTQFFFYTPLIVAVTIFGLSFFYILIADNEGDPFSEMSWNYPLGLDDLGRNILSNIIISTFYSLFSAVSLSVFTIILALAVTLLTRKKKECFYIFFNAVDSIPSVLWIMIAVSANIKYVTITTFAIFFVTILPSIYTIYNSELNRIEKLNYIVIPKSYGLSKYKLYIYHILPSMRTIFLPITIQLIGLSISINGSIGIFGIGSRDQLDLGMLIIRGKELYFFVPQLLITVLLVYIAIFFLLNTIFKKIS